MRQGCAAESAVVAISKGLHLHHEQHVAPGGFAPAPVQNATSQECKVQNQAALLGANFFHQMLLQVVQHL